MSMVEATAGLYWWNFEFEQRPVLVTTRTGASFVRSADVGMPRIPNSVLDATFFLYATEEDALADVNRGGTGFFVIRHFEGKNGPGIIYAVTNWHVAVSHGYSVVRVKRNDGGYDVFPLGPEEWTFKARDYDLAAIRFKIDENRHAIRALSESMFVTEQFVQEQDIGPGDDVFMVGLFVDHHHTTTPAVRFGHISMSPAPIAQTNGAACDSYAIDLHSRTGFSGSPVFVWRAGGPDLVSKTLNFGNRIMMLLGVHFGQFPERWELVGRAPLTAEGVSLPQDGRYVRGMSGMTCVAPAWAVSDLLNHGRLRAVVDAGRALWVKNNARPTEED